MQQHDVYPQMRLSAGQVETGLGVQTVMTLKRTGERQLGHTSSIWICHKQKRIKISKLEFFSRCLKCLYLKLKFPSLNRVSSLSLRTTLAHMDLCNLGNIFTQWFIVSTDTASCNHQKTSSLSTATSHELPPLRQGEKSSEGPAVSEFDVEIIQQIRIMIKIKR